MTLAMVGRIQIALVVALSVVSAARTARADEPDDVGPRRPAPSPDRQVVQTHWYGWQIMVSDGVALGLGLSANAKPEVLVPASLSTYAFGGAIVHAMHGNVGPAFGSVALRVVTPVVGVLGGAFVECIATPAKSPLAPCEPGTGAAIGGVLGGVTAIVLDAAVLGRERETTTKREPARGFLSPGVAPTRGGVAGTVTGTF